MVKLTERKLRELSAEGVFDGKWGRLHHKTLEANNPSKLNSVLGRMVVKADEMREWNHGFKYRLNHLIG